MENRPRKPFPLNNPTGRLPACSSIVGAFYEGRWLTWCGLQNRFCKCDKSAWRHVLSDGSTSALCVASLAGRSVENTRTRIELDCFVPRHVVPGHLRTQNIGRVK